MAGGWSRDGAVQDQIDASVQDAVDRARSRLPTGKSLSHCEECDAVPGVRLCIDCQSELDKKQATENSVNRRANKDSQLR